MILSVRGAAALVERRVRVYGSMVEANVLADLERYGVSEERAEEAVRWLLVRGRVVRRTDGGETYLTAPADWKS